MKAQEFKKSLGAAIQIGQFSASKPSIEQLPEPSVAQQSKPHARL